MAGLQCLDLSPRTIPPQEGAPGNPLPCSSLASLFHNLRVKQRLLPAPSLHRSTHFKALPFTPQTGSSTRRYKTHRSCPPKAYTLGDITSKEQMCDLSYEGWYTGHP